MKNFFEGKITTQNFIYWLNHELNKDTLRDEFEKENKNNLYSFVFEKAIEVIKVNLKIRFPIESSTEKELFKRDKEIDAFLNSYLYKNEIDQYIARIVSSIQYELYNEYLKQTVDEIFSLPKTFKEYLRVIKKENKIPEFKNFLLIVLSEHDFKEKYDLFNYFLKHKNREIKELEDSIRYNLSIYTDGIIEGMIKSESSVYVDAQNYISKYIDQITMYRNSDKEEYKKYIINTIYNLLLNIILDNDFDNYDFDGLDEFVKERFVKQLIEMNLSTIEAKISSFS